MTKTKEIVATTLICLLGFTAPVFAQEDMQGSQDHPDIPRIEGTYIVGYSQSPYDEGEFVTAMKDRKLPTVLVEGKRTRLAYLGPKSISPLFAMRNYQSALADLGEVTEVFSCNKNECYSNFPNIFIWAGQRRVENVLPGSQWAFGNQGYYRDQRYWYGTVTAASSRYHVSVYSTVFSDTNQVKGVRGYPFIFLEVLEEADFEPALEVVAPEEIAKSISEKGHIALYGIHFDLDSAELKPASGAALESVATAMRNDASLSMYVVGHTDNQGTYDYNLDLSKRRAVSVVAALAGDHEIAPERLKALGVGPAAPVASNKSEEGKALNRRVELVEF